MRIGVDFGGTKIEVAAMDEAGALSVRRRIATPADYRQAITAVCALIGEVEIAAFGLEARGASTVGVGAPGSISPVSGLMRNANRLWLNGQAFAQDLGVALGRPVRVANDANCLALSEAQDGAGAGQRVVFAAILGTGCGGGVVVDGVLREGRNGIGGEWGHSPLPWLTAADAPVPNCWCGKTGCLETYIAGTAFARDYADADADAGSRAGLDAQAVVTAALAGEHDACAALDRYIDRLGRALAVVCNLLDPNVIVLGGGMSNVAQIYERVPIHIARHVFSDVFGTPVLPALHGDSSGVRGAAWLWPAP